MAEDEMVGWHHQLNGYEFAQFNYSSPCQRVEAWCAAVQDAAKSWTQLSNGMTSTICKRDFYPSSLLKELDVFLKKFF